MFTDEERAILKVYLPVKSLRDRFKAACALNAVSMKEAIVEFVRQYVEESEAAQRVGAKPRRAEEELE